jgi:hypothetical protein
MDTGFRLSDRGADKKGLREPAQVFFFNPCRVGQIPPNRLMNWIPNVRGSPVNPFDRPSAWKRMAPE